MITHFGKTAIDAVLSYRKPTIIVLNPEWRYSVGERDAKILAEKLNAVLVKEVTPKAMKRAVDEAVNKTLPTYEDGASNLVRLILNH